MEIDEKHLAANADEQRKQPTYTNEPDATPRREGGDDALAEINPTDPAADEKVLTNDPVRSESEKQNAAREQGDANQ